MDSNLSMESFTCAHCGHHFESEPAETLVCPNCFWSTSVKKEEAPQITPFHRSVAPKLWLWSGGALFALVLFGISVFAFRHLKKQDEILQKIKSKNAHLIASEAPELTLSGEEQEILNRKIPLEAAPALTDQEKEILRHRILFRSRLTQGIPTPPWNEKQFEEFLKGEELRYQLPLERSYRRKLKQLFRDHYLPAAQAFEAGDFLKARDEWIRSLTLPIYKNDVAKHRGVVLTMLRAFVNDTLSKIGAMNASLMGKDRHATEEAIRSNYESLLDLLAKEGSWEEASAKVLELTKKLEGVEKLPKEVNPPPLPKEVASVDPDIREVLLAQVAPRQPSLPDWDSLGEDLRTKEKIIQSHLPGTWGARRKQYEEALLLIKNKNWQEARELLQKIDFPEALAEDARAKIRVINKLIHPSLDSQDKTG